MMPPPPQGAPVQMPPPGSMGQPMPPAAPRKKGLPRWLISIIAFVVIGGGVYAYNYFTSDVAQAKAGDCAKVSGTKSKPDYSATPCDSADANYIVGKSLSSSSDSCGGDYDEYIESGGRGPSTKLCLMPNWSEGSCYILDDDTKMGYPKVDCTAAGAVKVEKVVKGKADKAACSDNALAGTFPEPPTTFCLAPPA
jgi:hypothetical protein